MLVSTQAAIVAHQTVHLHNNVNVTRYLKAAAGPSVYKYAEVGWTQE